MFGDFVKMTLPLFADCGSGVICPLDNGNDMSSMCNRCNFDRTTHRCGSYPSNQVDTMATLISGDTEDSEELCLTEPVKIYTGEELMFLGKYQTS